MSQQLAVHSTGSEHNVYHISYTQHTDNTYLLTTYYTASLN